MRIREWGFVCQAVLGPQDAIVIKTDVVSIFLFLVVQRELLYMEHILGSGGCRNELK